MLRGRVSKRPFSEWRNIIALSPLAFRNVVRQRARSAIALVAVALGVTAIVIAGGFIEDVYIQFGESIIHSHYGHLQVYKQGYSAHGTQHPTEYLMDNSADVIGRVQGLPNVAIVLPRLRFTGLANAGGADWAIAGEGVDSKLENQLGTYVQLVDGRLLQEGDRYVAVLGDGVAKALHVGPGKRLSLNIVTSDGALNSLEFDIVGVFRSYSKEFDQRAVRIPLKAARDLLASTGINEAVVLLTDTSATAAAASEIRARLGPEYELKTWRDLADFYNKTVQLFDWQYGFLELVLLLMIVLSVANAINTAAFERLPEFGTMLALGGRPRDVFSLIMLECIALGAVGSAIGLGLGVTSALVISTIGIPMPPPPNADLGYVALIRVVPRVLLGAFAVGTISAAVAGIIPSLKIARIAPVEALRRAV